MSFPVLGRLELRHVPCDGVYVNRSLALVVLLVEDLGWCLDVDQPDAGIVVAQEADHLLAHVGRDIGRVPHEIAFGAEMGLGGLDRGLDHATLVVRPGYVHFLPEVVETDDGDSRHVFGNPRVLSDPLQARHDRHFADMIDVGLVSRRPAQSR